MIVIPSATLVLGFLILIVGAQGLIKGSSSLALRLGLPPLFIGLTIVAIGTSTPELVVSLNSAMHQHGDVSVGNVVGSNIFNIAVILGLTSLITPVRVHISMIRLDIPVMAVISVLAAVLFWSSPISRTTGLILVALLLCYFTFTFLASKNISEQDAADSAIAAINPPLSLIFLFGGLVMLYTGSQLVINSATKIAHFFHMSEAVIAITIVGMGTSIPELAASIVAALKKQPEMAIGNVVGSNIFNILGVLGISSLITPQAAPGVDLVDWSVMAAFALFLLPLAYTGKKLDRIEGAFLLTGYLGYVWWLLLSA